MKKSWLSVGDSISTTVVKGYDASLILSKSALALNILLTGMPSLVSG